MVTSKPFSTISYNSKEHLDNVLNRLTKDRKISFWFYIRHQPESDESKAHFHVYAVPAIRTFNTFQFEDELIEYITGEDLPRRVQPCRSSKFQDAYLYFIHDSAYLYSKGQSRKFHYREKDVITSDRDYLHEQINTIDWTKINSIGSVIAAAESGMSFNEFLKTYPLPILQVRSAEFIFKLAKSGELNSLDRNGRQSHTKKYE